MNSLFLKATLCLVLMLTVVADDTEEQTTSEEEECPGELSALLERVGLFRQLVLEKDVDRIYSEIFFPDSILVGGPKGSFVGTAIKDFYQREFNEGFTDTSIPGGPSGIYLNFSCTFAIKRGLVNRIFTNTQRTARWVAEWKKGTDHWRLAYYQWTYDI